MQRLMALNHFVQDVYNSEKIIKHKVIHQEILATSKNYRKECEEINLMFGVCAHICGGDLVRHTEKYYSR